MKIRASLFAAVMLAFLALSSCQKEISFEVNGNPNVDTTGNGSGTGNTSGDLLVRSEFSTVPASPDNSMTATYTFDANKRLIEQKATGKLNGTTTYGYRYYQRDADGLITFIRMNNGDSPDDSMFIKVIRNASKQIRYLLIDNEPAMVDPTDSIAVVYSGALPKERLHYSYVLGSSPTDPLPVAKEEFTWSNNAMTRSNLSVYWDETTQQWLQRTQMNFEYDNKKKPYDRTPDDVMCELELIEGGFSLNNNLVKSSLQPQPNLPAIPYISGAFKYGANNRPSEETLVFTPVGIAPGTTKTLFFYR